MAGLTERLRAVRQELDELERLVAQATTCRELGCNMVHVGGKNAGCGEFCGCSVPVHVCTRCGDSDYGENEWAERTLSECRDHYEGSDCAHST